MAAGSGSISYPTPAGEGVFSDVGGGIIGVALGIFTGAAIRNTDKALQRLYQETSGFAVDFAEFAIAELWWAAHLGTATSQLAGYLDEAGDSLNTLAHHQVSAWQVFLDEKYPADLRDLYNRLSARIPAQQKINLAPIEAAIKALQAAVRKEESWQKHVAQPRLNQWSRFFAEWKTTYAPPLATLRDWLKTPAHLATFALPAIVAGMPSTLRQRSSQASAAAIELALMRTWQSDPDQVYGLILNWLVAGN